MIEINLLPKELQKKKIKFEFPDLKFVPVAVGLVVLLITVQLIFSFTLALKRQHVKTLRKKWDDIKVQAKAAGALVEEADAIGNKIRKIEGVKTDRILWAKKLNELSDTIIPGMWFTSLSTEEGDEGTYLYIKGYISSFWKDETAMIAKFMKGLKENRSFSSDFEDVQLDAILKKRLKDVDVMSFSIKCYFKDKGKV